MTSKSNPRDETKKVYSRPPFWWGFVLAAIIAAVLYFAGSSAWYQLQALDTARTDARQWSIAQIEVELLKFAREIEVVDNRDTLAQVDLGELRKRYDVFYSRVMTISDSDDFKEIRKTPEVADALENLHKFLDITVRIIDSDDDELISELMILREETLEAIGNARMVSLRSSSLISYQSEQIRLSVLSSLSLLAATVFGLGAFLVLSLAALLVLINERRKRALHTAAVLEEARDQALAGEKAKAELLAVMSHEMRTPLNGVLGILELFADTRLSKTQKKYIERMRQSGEMLLQHVNSVLDISRADADQMEIKLKEFDLQALVENLIGSHRHLAAKHSNKLVLELSDECKTWVLGDAERLKQILLNLLANAIKFTEGGVVTISVSRDAASDTVEFRVIDTGIGIEEESLDRIFLEFVTLDTSYKRKVEGTGLGLGITKRLVNLMHGTMGVSSVVGEGSEFWVRLPLPETDPIGEVEAPTKPSVTADNNFGLSVLMVEDNEINRFVAKATLEKFGCGVTEAINGEEGVKTADEKAYDLILMDISMPVLDGVQAANLIRTGHGPNSKTPIFALTAHALPQDVERFKGAGMDRVIIKPMAIPDLLDALRRISGQ